MEEQAHSLVSVRLTGYWPAGERGRGALLDRARRQTRRIIIQALENKTPPSLNAGGRHMNRSIRLLTTLLMISAVFAWCQPVPTDSQTLQAILTELRQLRHDMQTTSAMAARAQVALYRLQREDGAVMRATQRVSDAKSRVTQTEEEKNRKTQDIKQMRSEMDLADNPTIRRELEEVMIPRLTAELELIQRHEQQARAEQAEAEQQLRDETIKLESLNDTLDRYNNALEDSSRK